ncbi:MAG: hypothetical protein WD894_26195, partial [Pirellulales bacterium]
MRRIAILLLPAVLICMLDAGDALAQGGAGAGGPFSRDRAPGFYFSIWKLGLYLGLFWLWVRTTDWVNQDGYRLGVQYAVWNPIVAFSFPAAMLLFFLIPWFWVGYT